MADANGGVVARLQELGMSAAGAQQVLGGQPIESADDRRVLADLLGGLMAPSTGLAAGDAIASSTEPGTSKVSSRIIAENFD